MKKIAIFCTVALLIGSLAFIASSNDAIAKSATITNLQPSGSSVPVSGNTFSWNAVSGTSILYDVVVSENQDLSNPVIQRSGLSSTSFAQQLNETMDAGTLHYYKVTARESGQIGVVAEGEIQFTTQQ